MTIVYVRASRPWSGVETLGSWIASVLAEAGESDVQVCKRLQRVARKCGHSTIYTPATDDDYRAYRQSLRKQD